MLLPPTRHSRTPSHHDGYTACTKVTLAFWYDSKCWSTGTPLMVPVGGGPGRETAFGNDTETISAWEQRLFCLIAVGLFMLVVDASPVLRLPCP